MMSGPKRMTTQNSINGFWNIVWPEALATDSELLRRKKLVVRTAQMSAAAIVRDDIPLMGDANPFHPTRGNLLGKNDLLFDDRVLTAKLQ